MADTIITQEKNEISKKELDEEISDHAGLSAEDAEFMRSYEGERGRKVVRKVCTPPCTFCTMVFLTERLD